MVPLLASNDQVKTESDRIEDLAVLGAITVIGLLILVVTCTNVSTLLVGLAAARRQEIAIRLSLGAPRARLVRQLVTESILLATAGGVLAIGILWALYRAFGTRFPDVPLTLDWTVLLFAFGFAVATGILFGALACTARHPVGGCRCVEEYRGLSSGVAITAARGARGCPNCLHAADAGRTGRPDDGRTRAIRSFASTRTREPYRGRGLRSQRTATRAG
ncbi:MAG: FtsX-like permease family protein [Longimicrobiales bacterium]